MLFLLDTWLTCFPEDFIGIPPAYLPDGVETEVRDDWHHRQHDYKEESPSLEATLEENSSEQTRKDDALDMIMDFIRTAILPCPMLELLGAGHLRADIVSDSTVGTDKKNQYCPFLDSFPCLYRVVKAVALDVQNLSSRSLSVDGKSNRNDGYDNSIIPLASVIFSVNARSRLRRITEYRMKAYYETIQSQRKVSNVSEMIDEELNSSVLRAAGMNTPETQSNDPETAVNSTIPPRGISRRRSSSHHILSEYLPWYKSELLQSSELRKNITQILASRSTHAMSLVMEQYHPLAVTLRAAEISAAVNDDDADSFTPFVKVVVTPIDKQILTYKYSKSKGFSGVAATMLALKHASGDAKTGETNMLGVNLTEAMKGHESEGSDDEDPDRNDDGFGPRNSFIGRETAIIVDEELGKELNEQVIQERRTLVRPIALWRRHKKRQLLMKKLEKWKEENNIPQGIDSSRGLVDGVIKASIIRGLLDSCKNSLLFIYSPSLLAYNMTMKLHYLYSTIPLLEFAVHAGFSSRSRRAVPMLARFRRESDRLQELFVDEVLCQEEPISRAALIISIILIGEAAARLWSHHLLMLVVQALQCHSIHRLKDTWKIVESLLPGSWSKLQDSTGFGGSTLLNAQMEKFIKFGVSDDRRKSIYIRKPEVVFDYSDTEDGYYELRRQCTESTVKKAVGSGILSLPKSPAVEDRCFPMQDSGSSTIFTSSISEGNLFLSSGFAERLSENIETDSFGDATAISAQSSDAVGGLNVEGAAASEYLCTEGEDSKDRIPSCSTIASGCYLNGNIGGGGTFAAGSVRDDASAELAGLPRSTPQAGMPYVNGILSKLIRLSDLPEYMRDPEAFESILFIPSPG